jgi:hypothetical protein
MSTAAQNISLVKLCACTVFSVCRLAFPPTVLSTLRFLIFSTYIVLSSRVIAATELTFLVSFYFAPFVILLICVFLYHQQHVVLVTFYTTILQNEGFVKTFHLMSVEIHVFWDVTPCLFIYSHPSIEKSTTVIFTVKHSSWTA